MNEVTFASSNTNILMLAKLPLIPTPQRVNQQTIIKEQKRENIYSQRCLQPDRCA